MYACMREEVFVRKIFIACLGLSFLGGPAFAEKVLYEYDVHGRLVRVVYCGDNDVCDSSDVARLGDDTTVEYDHDATDNRSEKRVEVPPP